jgi:hypothetical protein
MLPFGGHDFADSRNCRQRDQQRKLRRRRKPGLWERLPEDHQLVFAQDPRSLPIRTDLRLFDARGRIGLEQLTVKCEAEHLPQVGQNLLVMRTTLRSIIWSTTA